MKIFTLTDTEGHSWKYRFRYDHQSNGWSVTTDDLSEPFSVFVPLGDVPFPTPNNIVRAAIEIMIYQRTKAVPA